MSKKKPSTVTGQTRQGRIVLSEEEYTSTLNHIVQRDFFPDLPKLERQAALLEKRSQGDIVGAAAIRRATRQLADHEDVLEAQEEEDEHDLEDGNVRRRARPLPMENISGFHARVTNEDDAEFDSNQKEEVKANRERLEKLFRPQDDSSKMPLLEMASDQFLPESNRIAAAEWAKPSMRNSLFFNPTPLRDESGRDSNGQKLLTNSSNSVAQTSESRASLIMPPPANVEKKTKFISLPKHALVEYIPKHALEKKIEPSQTRFPSKIVPAHNRSLFTLPDDSETDGSTTDASTDLDAPLRPIEQERRNRHRKAERTQQSYVAMTPLIVPGAGNQSPVTTWGTVMSTPIVISGQEVNGPQIEPANFSLPFENNRERAARKAELELSRRAKRAKTSGAKRNRRTPSLGPAALSLLEKTKRTPSTRPKDAFASALRGSYTPKPRARTSSKKRPSDSAYNATPLASQNFRAQR